MTTSMVPANSKASEHDILRLLDELESLVDGCKHLLSHALWLDLDTFFALTNSIRQHLPDDIRRATKVARDSEKIVEQARAEAERIRAEAAEDAERILADSRRNSERALRDAVEQANRMVADHEIVKGAQQQGDAILDAARTEAQETRNGADEYAAQVLIHLDDILSKAGGHVRRGLQKLERDPKVE